MNASILTTLNFLTEYAFSFFSHPSYLFLGISRKLSKKSQVLHWLETAPMHMYKLYASILFVSSESLAHSHYMCSLTLFAQSPSPPNIPIMVHYEVSYSKYFNAPVRLGLAMLGFP